MNAQQPYFSRIHAPDAASKRSDETTEAHLNLAIALLSLGNTAHAARYLKNHDIDVELARRVLSRPGQRRQY